MTTTISKNEFFLIIILFIILNNILIIFDFNQFFIRPIIASVFIFIIPGLLFLLTLKVLKLGFWEMLLYSIGLSVAFLMIVGLFVNWTLPLFGIEKPLSSISLLIVFNIFILVLNILAYINNKSSFKIKFPTLTNINRVFLLIVLLIPFLSIIGAFLLNNGNVNIIAILTIGLIAVYIFALVIFRNKISEHIFPVSIYLIALSLLFSISLRSWHISGWDISFEYQMFQYTLQRSFWSIENSFHTYNGLLSITLLPTVISALLNINPEYIFKLIFPIIFALMPLGLYIFFSQYGPKIIAYLASFFFISQWLFYMEMPALARQQIAFLFFMLLLMALFSKNIQPIAKNILSIIFGLSMIVSHYTTTYIVIALLITVYFSYILIKRISQFEIISKKLKLIENYKNKKKYSSRNFSLTILFFLILSTILWYGPITGIFSDVNDLRENFFRDLKNLGSHGLQIPRHLGVLQYTDADVRDYIDTITQEYTENENIKRYPNSVISQVYQPRIINPELIPPINETAKTIIIILRKIVRSLIGLSLIIGFLYLCFKYYKGKTSFDGKYILMIPIVMIFIIANLMSPTFSISYGFFRLVQQSLVILSLCIIFGLLTSFLYFKYNFRIKIVTSIILIYFLFQSTFFLLVIGGQPRLNFYNYGDEYNSHYTHEAEVKSIKWLIKNYNPYEEIYADKYAELKIRAFGLIDKKIFTLVIPSIIDQSAYVYASRTNIEKKKSVIIDPIFFKTGGVDYNYPLEFLNQNKNFIYNNGKSGVYK